MNTNEARRALLLFDSARIDRDEIGFQHFLDSANGQVVVWAVLHQIIQAGRRVR
jgi:hypothetical protein